MATTPFITLRKVSIRKGNASLLDQLNWRILQGENWVITGPMGSGKSSLASCLTGKMLLQSGDIVFDFLPTSAQSFTERLALRNSNIQLISFADSSTIFSQPDFFYQQRYQASNFQQTIDVYSFLTNKGYFPYDPAHQELIDQLQIRPLYTKDITHLSSGQMRRVLLASALFSRPQLLILDDPYLGLDEEGRRTLNALLTTLVSNHGVQLILVGCEVGWPEIMNKRLHLDGKGHATEVPLEFPLMAQAEEETFLQPLISLMNQNRPTLREESILRLENVSVVYEKGHALKNLSWNVKAGEKWGVYGPNGSGKSTLLSLLYGDHPQAYSNHIYLFDQRRGKGESIWDIKARIGFTSSEFHAYFESALSCRQVVLTGFTDSFVPKTKLSEIESDIVRLLFQYFHIDHLPELLFKQVSTGEQRLVLFLRALVKNPPVLLLDEPFQAFDSQTIQRSLRLLDSLLDDDHTLLFITHDPSEFPACVRKLLMLEQGIRIDPPPQT